MTINLTMDVSLINRAKHGPFVVTNQLSAENINLTYKDVVGTGIIEQMAYTLVA